VETMSAASARRRKQLLAKKLSHDESNVEECVDPIIARLNALLEESAAKRTDSNYASEEAEAISYEALQLAQSQVRKCVKAGDGKQSFDIASDAVIKLLHNTYIGMASQLANEMVDALTETQTASSPEIMSKVEMMDAVYKAALDEKKNQPDVPAEEMERLHRAHATWLKKMIKYSSDFGSVRLGEKSLHLTAAHASWDVGDREDAVLHYALAEEPLLIAERLMSLPPNPPDAPVSPAALRDALLSRAVLTFLSLENMRDANALVRAFIERDTTRDAKQLAVAYLDKEKKQPTHVTFCCALLRICETEATALYQWLLRSFSKELNLYPDLQPYTTKIGRIYFGIEPPPSMMSMMENMMTMMSGGAGPGGFSPAMFPAGFS
jgi:hypothetical protein